MNLYEETREKIAEGVFVVYDGSWPGWILTASDENVSEDCWKTKAEAVTAYIEKKVLWRRF